MPGLTIIYTPHFERTYRQLPMHVKKMAEQRESLFRLHPFHSTLKTHKLGGELRGLWAFSIDFKHRIVFEFAGQHTVYFHTAGDHSIYQ